MSRLYGWLLSDTNKRAKTITGDESIEAIIHWGSSSNSKRAIRICVLWEKDSDIPTVYVNNDFAEGDASDT